MPRPASDIAKTNGEVFREIFDMLDTQCSGRIPLDDATFRACCLTSPCRPESIVWAALLDADPEKTGALDEQNFIRVLRRITENIDLRQTREAALQVVRDLRTAKRRRFLMFADRTTGADVDQEQLALETAGGPAALSMYLELFDYALRAQQAEVDAAFATLGSSAPSSAKAYARVKALQDERSISTAALVDLLGFVCPDHDPAEVGEMVKVAALTSHGGIDSTEFLLLIRGARIATPLSDMAMKVRLHCAAQEGLARPKPAPHALPPPVRRMGGSRGVVPATPPHLPTPHTHRSPPPGSVAATPARESGTDADTAGAHPPSPSAAATPPARTTVFTSPAGGAGVHVYATPQPGPSQTPTSGRAHSRATPSATPTTAVTSRTAASVRYAGAETLVDPYAGAEAIDPLSDDFSGVVPTPYNDLTRRGGRGPPSHGYYSVRETGASPLAPPPPYQMYTPGGLRYQQVAAASPHHATRTHPPGDAEAYRDHVVLGRGMSRRSDVRADIEEAHAREVVMDERRQALLDAMSGLDDVLHASSDLHAHRDREAAEEADEAMASALRKAIPVSLQLARGGGGGGDAGDLNSLARAAAGRSAIRTSCEARDRVRAEHRDALLASHERNVRSLHAHADWLWEEHTYRSRRLRPPPEAPPPRRDAAAPMLAVTSLALGGNRDGVDPAIAGEASFGECGFPAAERESIVSTPPVSAVGGVRSPLPTPTGGVGGRAPGPSPASTGDAAVHTGGDDPSLDTPHQRGLRAAFLRSLSDHVHHDVYPMYSTLAAGRPPPYSLAVFDDVVRDASRPLRDRPPAEPFSDVHRDALLRRVRYQSALRECIENTVRPMYDSMYKQRFARGAFERMIAEAVESPRRTAHAGPWSSRDVERLVERVHQNAQQPQRFASTASLPAVPMIFASHVDERAGNPSPAPSTHDSYFSSPQATSREYRAVREAPPPAIPHATMRVAGAAGSAPPSGYDL